MSWADDEGFRPGDRDVIDLWRFALDENDATALETSWAALAPDERTRAERLIIPAKRRQFVVGRARLRTILARHLDRDPASLTFAYGAHGKPEIPEYPELSFNLSHSGDTALLGVCFARRLGVDVEETRPGRDFVAIAEHFFSGEERAALDRIGDATRAHAFYRAWTRKEAYLKAIGTGLSFASTRFTITFDPDRPSSVVATEYPGDRPENWRVVDVEPGRSCAAALCVEANADASPPHVRTWQFGARSG